MPTFGASLRLAGRHVPVAVAHLKYRVHLPEVLGQSTLHVRFFALSVLEPLFLEKSLCTAEISDALIFCRPPRLNCLAFRPSAAEPPSLYHAGLCLTFKTKPGLSRP